MIIHNEHILRFVAILKGKGIINFVISPGSRNAPIIIELSKHDDFKLFSIVDERSAAFFAIGMAQQTNSVVALVCTSGSALANYAPAVIEAYYQQIPLLIISADRPYYIIDQKDGQTLKQPNIFDNFIRKSINIPHVILNNNDRNFIDRVLCEAIDKTTFNIKGPVHINFPIDEPLYNNVGNKKLSIEPRVINTMHTTNIINNSQLNYLAKKWNKSNKKMILIGQLPHNNNINTLLAPFENDNSTIILSETISNININNHINCIDKTILGIKDNDIKYEPEILFTFGNNIVSKKIKRLLRKYKIKEHWNINNDNENIHIDTFGKLTLTIPMQYDDFIKLFGIKIIANNSNYKSNWLKLKENQEIKHDNFLKKIPFCDLIIYEKIIKHIPQKTHLHCSNSSPIRYIQLFNINKSIRHSSNRGVSGIDGCVSTAVGAAIACNTFLTVITGDIGFFYDSNSLFNSHVNNNLRIIVINNKGGNIFRIIEKEAMCDVLTTYLEANHQFETKKIAETYGLHYFKAANMEELNKSLSVFYNNYNSAVLLEIVTDNINSSKIINNYFKILQQDDK